MLALLGDRLKKENNVNVIDFSVHKIGIDELLNNLKDEGIANNCGKLEALETLGHSLMMHRMPVQRSAKFFWRLLWRTLVLLVRKASVW